MLRAFEVSQTEANSDSLTGLMTRRSLEAGCPGAPCHRHAVLAGLRRPRPLQEVERFVRAHDRRPHAAHLLPSPPGLPPSRRHPGSLRGRGVRHRAPRLPRWRGTSRSWSVSANALADRITIAAVSDLHRQFRAGGIPPGRGLRACRLTGRRRAFSMPRPEDGTRSSYRMVPLPPVTNPAAASVRLEPRPRTNGGSPTEAAPRAPAQLRRSSAGRSGLPAAYRRYRRDRREAQPVGGHHVGVAQRSDCLARD